MGDWTNECGKEESYNYSMHAYYLYCNWIQCD